MAALTAANFLEMVICTGSKLGADVAPVVNAAVELVAQNPALLPAAALLRVTAAHADCRLMALQPMTTARVLHGPDVTPADLLALLKHGPPALYTTPGYLTAPGVEPGMPEAIVQNLATTIGDDTSMQCLDMLIRRLLVCVAPPPCWRLEPWLRRALPALDGFNLHSVTLRTLCAVLKLARVAISDEYDAVRPDDSVRCAMAIAGAVPMLAAVPMTATDDPDELKLKASVDFVLGRMRSKYATLMAAVEATCALCCVAPRTHVLLPCMHARTCEACSARLTECPWCKTRVTKYTKCFQ
jgi:hypothetical protein